MIWVDVEDLFDYARQNSRPSGIQRLAYELCRELQSLSGSPAAIRFVRSRRPAPGYDAVPFTAVERQFRTLSMAEQAREQPRAADMAGAALRPRSAAYRWARERIRRLPDRLRAPLTEAYYHQTAALGASARLARTVLRRRAPPTRGVKADPAAAGAEQDGRTMPPAAAEAGEFERHVRPGDVLLVLGAAWMPGYAAAVADIVRRKRMRLAIMMYDVVPLRRPEWCDPATLGPFAAWVHDMLPLAETVFAISRSTVAEIQRYAADTGLTLRRPPQPIPIGTGFSRGTDGAATGPAPAPRADLPAAGGYALIVSTIEARKNHALLFRVWRQLLDDLPEDRVPTLVFAGRIGWLVGDLMTQLASANFLRGKIVLIDKPSDADLQALYEGCLFTLFPSFYEGWGLPVTESLSYGRPCFISRATSLPEAGGALARYFDPENGAEAYRMIRAVIEDPHDLAEWRARIAREFRPVAWADSARAIIDTLADDAALARAGEAVLGITA